MAEHNGNNITPITYNTISAAQKLGHEINVLVVGEDCSKVNATSLAFITLPRD